jgi:hypothetical protein
MSLTLRISLAAAGLVIIVLSVLLLMNALTPVEILRARETLPPTLFAPP